MNCVFRTIHFYAFINIQSENQLPLGDGQFTFASSDLGNLPLCHPSGASESSLNFFQHCHR